MERDSSGFAGNLRRFRSIFGLSQAEVAKIASVSDQAVSAWETGKSTPRLRNVKALADYSGLPISVFADPDAMDAVDPVTRRLTKSWAYVSDENNPPMNSLEPFTADATAPLYGRIAAGTPIAVMPVEDSMWVDPKVLAAHPNGFFLRVEGESMNRVLPNGCYAFVDPDAEVNSGDVAALHIDGLDATIKRVHKGATSVVLSPDSTDNSLHDQIFDFTQPGTDQITVIGKVVWYLPPYDAIVRL